jgi:hypothetical protein
MHADRSLFDGVVSRRHANGEGFLEVLHLLLDRFLTRLSLLLNLLISLLLFVFSCSRAGRSPDGCPDRGTSVPALALDSTHHCPGGCPSYGPLSSRAFARLSDLLLGLLSLLLLFLSLLCELLGIGAYGLLSAVIALTFILPLLFSGLSLSRRDEHTETVGKTLLGLCLRCTERDKHKEGTRHKCIYSFHRQVLLQN